MQNKAAASALAAASGILILILDSKTALSGATEGLQLIISTVIPSLFPFFFLSIWLTSSAGSAVFPLLRPLGRLFGIPAGAEHLLIPSFLGGYPAGAQAVASAWEQGRLSAKSAERLLSFCSNAGPSFIFGILSGMFPDTRMVWLLWLLHILGALLAARVFSAADNTGTVLPAPAPKPAPEILKASLQVMATVSGWVLLFRILIAFLERWFLWLFSGEAAVLVTGLLEMTNGCCSLNRIADIRLRFVLCSVLLSCGGLCITMQTRSVAKSLNLRYYAAGKGIQTAFCAISSCILAYQAWEYLLVLAVLILCLTIKRRKRSSFPVPTDV